MQVRDTQSVPRRQRALWIRLLAGLLSALCALSVLTAAAAADETDGAVSSRTHTDHEGASLANTYVLAVSTGYAPGTSIQYISIRYVDVNDVLRTAFVFPHEGTLNEGYQMAAEISQPADRIKNVKNRTEYELKQTYLAEDGLTRNSYDTYLFECYYEIKEILFIDVYMTHLMLKNNEETGESTKNEWTCNGLTVYKADKVYGMRMAGYYSSSFYLDFDGTCLASLDMGANECYDFSLNKSDVLYRMGDGVAARYKLNREFGDDAVYRTMDNMKRLLFRIDLADTYGSGIEALVNEYKDKKKALTKMELNECLAIEFKYVDTFGIRRRLMLPVITSFLSYAVDLNPSLADKAVIGVAQQGDTLIFEAEIPDYASMHDYTLYYGNNVVDECKITAVSSVRRTEREDRLKDDRIAFTGLSIYDADEASVEIYTEDAALRCSVTGTPLLFYRAASTGGQTVRAEESREMGTNFSTIEPDTPGSSTVTPELEEQMYVVEIKTDNMPAAGTVDNLYAAFTYIATDGTEKTPSRISLKDVSRDWLGYWPTSTGEDISYLKSVSAGSTLTFALNYPDVRYFKSVEFSSESASDKDDWQMTSISIYLVNSVSCLCAEWLDTDKTVNDIVTDREMYRTFDKSQRKQYCEKTVLLNPDMDSIKIVFDGSGGGSTEETEINWNAIKYSMTLNEAMSDLGFTRIRREYEVTVKVRSNAVAENDDCGSNNKFYFQLIFETGKSSYVQANQQLMSDGFRAGKAEVFTITVNRDYGDLRAVRIIPDDTIDTENIYDKLNVDYIQIIEKADASVSHSWRVNNVNWIGIDFKDTGAESSQQTHMTRFENEMCRSYAINARGYAINFQVAVSYGGFSKDSSGNADHYSGSLYMEITYVNSESKELTTTVDVARAMAEYAKRSPIENKSENANSGTSDDDDTLACLIDNSYMMRAGSVDRFLVSITDVKKIKKVTLLFEPKSNCSFTVNSISFYLITSGGTLLLNDANEYQWDWKTEFVTSNSDKEPRNISVIGDKPSDIQFDMQDNTINITESWNSVVEREPTGNDDTVNLYIFPSEKPKTVYPNVEATVKYQAQFVDRPYQVMIKQGNGSGIAYSKDRNMYYAIGVSTASMSMLKSLKLESDTDLHVDHAIIQQVRYGVVVNTYYFDFGKDTVRYAVECVPKLGGDGTSEEQILHMTFSKDTDIVRLSAEQIDLAALIRFTTVNDMNEIVYDSAYVFLTDQGIKEIKPGTELTVKFTDMYVKDVVGISLVGMGEYHATVDSASVWTYQIAADGSRTCTGQYAALSPIGITRSKQTANLESTVLSLLNMEFAANPVMDEAAASPERVSMEIKVTTPSGQPAHITLDDLTPYLTSGSFAAGETAKLALVMKDVKSVDGIILNVHGEDTVWDLNGISVKWQSPDGIKEFYHTVNGKITEGKEIVINSKTVKLWVQPEICNAQGELAETLDKLSSPESGEVKLAAGDYLRLPGGIENAVPGYDTFVTEVRLLSGTADAKPETMIEEVKGAIVFRPPVPTDGDAVYYVTVSAKENASVNVTLTVTVHPEAAE